MIAVIKPQGRQARIYADRPRVSDKTVALDGSLISKFLLDKQREWRGEDILDLGSTRSPRRHQTIDKPCELVVQGVELEGWAASH